MVLGGPEFDRIPNILDLRRKLLKSTRNKRIDFYLTEKIIDENISELIRKLLFPALRKSGKEYISEKTPWNILGFPELIELFPGSKFIHVVRNPYAVFASMKQVAERAKKKNVVPPDFTKDLSLFLYYMQSVYRINSALSKGFANTLTIKYEDIIQIPNLATQKLASFIGIEWTDEMLDPGKKSHPGESQMVKDEIWYSQKNIRSNLDLKNLNKWESSLTLAEKYIINQILEKDENFRRLEYKIEVHLGIGLINKIRLDKQLKSYYKKYKNAVLPLRTLP